jgi:hypothetical protein
VEEGKRNEQPPRDQKERTKEKRKKTNAKENGRSAVSRVACGVVS